jgi:hypothetical protein
MVPVGSENKNKRVIYVISSTLTVIIAFEYKLSEKVSVDLYSSNVQQFILHPIGRGKSHKFGRKATDCHQSTDTCMFTLLLVKSRVTMAALQTTRNSNVATVAAHIMPP